MVKNHLKRIAMPRSWQTKRKGIKFITRPNSGAHRFSRGMSLDSIMKQKLGAETTKEVKAIASSKDVLVDGIPRRDHRHIVGLFDVVQFPKTKKNYRIILNRNSKIDVIENDDKSSNLKPCKIKNKTKLGKDKIQLNLTGGRNLVIKKNAYAVGDTIIINIPKQEIKEHLPLQKGSFIFLSGGKYSGKMGTIQDIQGKKIILESTDNKRIETLKKYSFVIGKDKPMFKVEK